MCFMSDDLKKEVVEDDIDSYMDEPEGLMDDASLLDDLNLDDSDEDENEPEE
jgi:hypothetical protein